MENKNYENIKMKGVRLANPKREITTGRFKNGDVAIIFMIEDQNAEDLRAASKFEQGAHKTYIRLSVESAMTLAALLADEVTPIIDELLAKDEKQN